MNRIFIYVVQRAGVVDDSAAELLRAAKKISPAGQPTVILTGNGSELDAACESLRSSFREVWKLCQ